MNGRRSHSDSRYGRNSGRTLLPASNTDDDRAVGIDLTVLEGGRCRRRARRTSRRPGRSGRGALRRAGAFTGERRRRPERGRVVPVDQIGCGPGRSFLLGRVDVVDAGRRAGPQAFAGGAELVYQRHDDGLTGPGQIGAELDQHLAGDAVALPHHAQQDVFGADLAVSEPYRLARRQLEDPLGRWVNGMGSVWPLAPSPHPTSSSICTRTAGSEISSCSSAWAPSQSCSPTSPRSTCSVPISTWPR